MKHASLPSSAPAPTIAVTIAPDILDRFYLRVFGFMYQVLGDAELAAQASEAVFVRREPPGDDLAVWRAALATVRSYLARGFVVRPLAPPMKGWQADLLGGLARLTPLERALLLLRYHEGLELEMLARVMGLDESELRAQIAAARSRLLDVLETP
jgi:hypothetical protein